MNSNWVQRLSGKSTYEVPTSQFTDCFNLEHCSVRGLSEPTFQTISDRRGMTLSHFLVP
jgi:hypothetical protein